LGSSRAVFAASLALAFFAAPSAHAIEHQHHVGLAPELAILSINGKSTTDVGVGGALHYAYGLSDQWNVAVEASYAVVATDEDSPNSPRNRPSTVAHATAGIGYVIDILRWVPYIGAQGGVYRLAGGTLDDALVLPGVAIAGGLDYQFSRHVAAGVGARQHFMISKMDTYPSYTTVLLRFELMWGY
jgi:hypothetical protein